MADTLNKIIEEHYVALQAVKDNLLPRITEIAEAIKQSLQQGGKVLIFGNGGSAADAQHFATELSGRFTRERRALAAVALTTDTSALTAIGNDYGFDQIFERQILALAKTGDVAVGITTSGNSANVVNALIAARDRGAVTVALSGGDGGRAAGEAKLTLIVPCAVTARIQEMHILAIHMICELVEQWAAEEE